MSDIAQEVQNLGQAIQPPLIKPKDLTIGNSYKILNLKKVKTKHGDAVMCLLDMGLLFLPKRFHILTQEKINALNAKNILLVYEGDKIFSNGLKGPVYSFIEDGDNVCKY